MRSGSADETNDLTTKEFLEAIFIGLNTWSHR